MSKALIGILIDEQNKLEEKMLQLDTFMNHKVYYTLTETHHKLIKQQFAAMGNYKTILELRIADLKK